jgi:flagellar assembly protein FliH
VACRITESALDAETIAWPGLPASGASLRGPASQPAHRAAGPGAAESAERRGDSSETEGRLAELDRLRQMETADARHRGVEEGLRRGREEAATEVQKAFDQVARALRDLALLKRTLRQQAEQELIKLSLAVARRILYRELSTDPSSIEGIVHAALQKLQHREVSRVRVYPAAVSAVRAALDRIGSRAAIEVIADPGLETGAILFETSFGELDASIETQLQEIQRGFADRLAIR